MAIGLAGDNNGPNGLEVVEMGKNPHEFVDGVLRKGIALCWSVELDHRNVLILIDGEYDVLKVVHRILCADYLCWVARGAEMQDMERMITSWLDSTSQIPNRITLVFIVKVSGHQVIRPVVSNY